MAKYKAYPEYKDSGVEWLGEIPRHWQRFPLKYLVEMKSGESITAADIEPEGNYPVFGGNGLRGYSSKYTHSGSYILIGRQGALCGNVNYAHNQFWASEHALVVKGKKSFNIRWLGELLRSMNLNQYSITAAQPGLSAEALVNLQIPVPPEAEREAVASFIDYEAGKIDNLIEKQQQLIELLKEKRQAVISHAVTKGLNPDVPMKDSGVEWLGEVPAHWDICLLKFKCSAITDGAHISPDTNEGEYYFVSIKDINKGIIDFNNSLLTSSSSYKYLVKTGCKPFSGDILFSKDGTIGQTAIVPDDVDFVVASSLIIIRADKEKASPAFMDLLLQSSLVKEQVESFVKGAALRRLSIQNLEKVFGIFPTLSEQQIISDYIYAQLNRLDVLESKAVVQIQLLEERRTALISAAVTGKIDVRDWVAPGTQDVEAPQEAIA